MWGAITYPWLRYLPLATKSSYTNTLSLLETAWHKAMYWFVGDPSHYCFRHWPGTCFNRLPMSQMIHYRLQRNFFRLETSWHWNSFPVMHTFNEFFNVRLNQLLNKQSSFQWFETIWRSCDVTLMSQTQSVILLSYISTGSDMHDILKSIITIYILSIEMSIWSSWKYWGQKHSMQLYMFPFKS